MVVHVELHLRVDPAEIGHEAAEHANLVEPAQRAFGIVPAGQQFQEQRVGARIIAHRIDAAGIAQGAAQRIGMNLDRAADRAMEVLEHTINGRFTAAEALRHDEFVLTKLYESA